MTHDIFEWWEQLIEAIEAWLHHHHPKPHHKKLKRIRIRLVEVTTQQRR